MNNPSSAQDGPDTAAYDSELSLSSKLYTTPFQHPRRKESIKQLTDNRKIKSYDKKAI